MTKFNDQSPIPTLTWSLLIATILLLGLFAFAGKASAQQTITLVLDDGVVSAYCSQHGCDSVPPRSNEPAPTTPTEKAEWITQKLLADFKDAYAQKHAATAAATTHATKAAEAEALVSDGK